MKQLVASWVQAEREHYGQSLAQAVRRVNQTHGTRLTSSRVSEWRRGVYTPSQRAISHLLFRTLPWALKQAGVAITAAQLREFKKRLWVIEVRDNHEYLEML